jgi:hypothetical protein
LSSGVQGKREQQSKTGHTSAEIHAQLLRSG